MRYKTYAGNGKPYLYAMFTSEDRDEVQPVLESMAGRGYAIWPTSVYDKHRMDKAALVVLFLSPPAAADDTINRAVNYAMEKNKAVLIIHLAPTELTPAQKLMLNSLQGILRYDCDTEEAFYEKLYGSVLLQDLKVMPAQKRASRRLTLLLGGAAILAAAAAAVFLLSPSDAIVPEDSLIAELGFSGKMSDINEIWVYGARTMDVCVEKVFASPNYLDDNADNRALYFDNGMDYMTFGSIDDISDFSQLLNLQQLALAGNRITDLSPLFNLEQLYYLDVSVNPIQSVEGIGVMKALQTVYLGFTGITDFSPLLACPSLEQVYVDQTQQEAAQSVLLPAGITVTAVGPAEELDKIKCLIHDGPFVGNLDQTYGFVCITRSGSYYPDYSYSLTKNGEPVTILELEPDDDAITDQPNRILSKESMGDYDTNDVLILEVTYDDRTAAYQLWHEADSNHPFANEGILLWIDSNDKP